MLIILQIFDRNTFSEKLTEAKEKVKADNDRVKPIEEQFRNILRMVLKLMPNDGNIMKRLIENFSQEIIAEGR